MRVHAALLIILALLQGSQPPKAPPVAVKSLLVLSLRTTQSVTRCSNEKLNEEFFTSPTSVAAYYAENSNNMIRISGTVSGPHTIAIEPADATSRSPRMPGDGCNRTTWADAADAAATAAGLNLSAYAYKAYIEPPGTDTLCRFAADGLTNLPRIWLNNDSCDSKHMIAYSFGEAFGAPNAATAKDPWGDASTSLGGFITPSDLSLWNSMVHFNAPEKISMGWLPVANVRTVTAAGNFQLAFLDGRSAEVQALAIKVTGDTGYYYVSYRRAVGFSSDLRAEYADKLSVHQWSGGTRTLLLANLADGQSFTDSSGLRVTQVSHDATHSNVAVSFNK